MRLSLKKKQKKKSDAPITKYEAIIASSRPKLDLFIYLFLLIPRAF